MYPLTISNCDLDRFLAILGRLTSPFHELPNQRSIDPRTDGEPVLVGHAEGFSYLLELGVSLLGMNWGLLAKLSKETQSLVVSCAYDSFDGQHEYVCIKNGEVTRAFWNNPARITQPYSRGTPLASEATMPLSTSDGLQRALLDLGFDLVDLKKAFQRSSGDRWVGWRVDGLSLLKDDHMKADLDAHIRQFWNPAYKAPVPRVRVRQI